MSKEQAKHDRERHTGYARTVLTRCKEALADPRREARHALRQCEACYYVIGGAIAGHGFTEWECRCCGARTSWRNTATPRLCGPCADLLDACVRCGGARDVDLQGGT
jgi:hypothetical protein